MFDRIEDNLINTLKTNCDDALNKFSSITGNIELNEYESKLIWFIKQLISDLHCCQPDEVPFNCLTECMKDKDIVSDLKKLLTFNISTSVKARICDCLWIYEKDYSFAKSAFDFYIDLINSEDEFGKCYHMVVRCISIQAALKNPSLLYNLSNIVDSTLNKAKGRDGFFPYNILEWCFTYKIRSDDAVIQLCSQQILDSKSNELSEVYMLLQEKIYLRRNKIKNANKLVNDPDIIKVRRNLADIYIIRANADNNFIRKINYLKKALKLLKILPGTEDERIKLLKQIDTIGQDFHKDSQSSSIKSEVDITDSVMHVNSCVDSIDDISMAILFFLTQNKFVSRDAMKESVIESSQKFISKHLFPTVIIDKNGKVKVQIPTLDIQDPTGNVDALNANIDHAAREHSLIMSSIFIKPAFQKIIKKFKIDENLVRSIVEKSLFVPVDRQNAYIKGIIAGFKKDFVTALHLLVPQVENSVRYLARECGDAVYSINEQGFETSRTFDDILKMPDINDCISEDILFTIKWVFTSKYGLNIRNEIAHSTLDDNELTFTLGMFVWWTIFKICFLFSPIKKSEYDNMLSLISNR